MAATIFNSGHHCLPNGVTFLVEKKNIPTPFLVATASHYYLMIATYVARAHGQHMMWHVYAGEHVYVRVRGQTSYAIKQTASQLEYTHILCTQNRRHVKFFF